MEGKEKIVLKDNTVFAIENGASENQVEIILQTVDEVPDVFRKFTEDNLEIYQIKNAEGLTCTTKKNKYCVDAVITERESDVLLTMRLADVDMTQKQLAELKTEIETVKADIGTVHEGQDIQDGAIYDLGKNVSQIMEGENES